MSDDDYSNKDTRSFNIFQNLKKLNNYSGNSTKSNIIDELINSDNSSENSENQVTTITTRSWTQRLMDSIKGIIFGIIFICCGIALLWWNEENSINTIKTLEIVKEDLHPALASPIDQGNNGKLLYINGIAVGRDDNLTDNQLRVTAQAIKLVRKVEIYQWEEIQESETQKTSGGGEKTITKYRYNKIWSDRVINSKNFKKSNYTNTGTLPIFNQTWVNKEIKVGDFKLSESLVNKIDSWQEYIITSENSSSTTIELSKEFKIVDGKYATGDLNNPQIGDIRVSYSIIPMPLGVSIIAKQINDTLDLYPTKYGSVNYLFVGNFSSDQMIKNLLQENTLWTWCLRVIGSIIIWIGFTLIFRPISILADFIPILGYIVDIGSNIIAFALTFIVSLATIAIAYFYYKPMLSLVLGLLILAIIVSIMSICKSTTSYVDMLNRKVK